MHELLLLRAEGSDMYRQAATMALCRDHNIVMDETVDWEYLDSCRHIPGSQGRLCHRLGSLARILH